MISGDPTTAAGSEPRPPGGPIKNRRRFLSGWPLGFAAVFSLLAGAYFSCFVLAKLEIEIRTEAGGTLQIFWAPSGKGFNEARSSAIRISPHRQRYTVYIANLTFPPSLNAIRHLRLDPIDRPARVVISRLRILRPGQPAIDLQGPALAAELRPAHAIDSSSGGPQGLELVSGGNDPQLTLDIEGRRPYGFAIAGLLIALVCGWLLGWGIVMLDRLCPGFEYIPAMLAIALVLAATAAVRGDMLHLDEEVHIAAAAYYEDHWLPPAICQPGTEKTYSIYGASRLNTYEIVYLVAGKFSRLLRPLGIERQCRLRLFNALLLLLVAAFCLRSPSVRLLAIPLVISPQVWHGFSYFNGEPFSLFVLLVVSHQVLVPESRLNRGLSGAGSRAWISVPGTVLLPALLLLIKKNFWIFIPFLLIHLLAKLWDQSAGHRRRQAVAMLVIVSATVGGFGLRIGIDHYVNGPDRRAQLRACQQKLALPAYRPDTSLEKRYQRLNLRDRGVTLRDMIGVYRWGTLTAASAFGVYYIVPSAPKPYYALMELLAALLALTIVVSLVRGGGLPGAATAAALVGCGLLLCALSLYHSWVSDFQAQGRYLFPLLSMAGFALLCARDRLANRWLHFLVPAMFLASGYNFIFFAPA